MRYFVCVFILILAENALAKVPKVTEDMRIGSSAPRQRVLRETEVENVYTGWLRTTMIVFPKALKVVSASSGDQADWPVSYDKNENLLEIKGSIDPRLAKIRGVPPPPSETNLNVRTSDGGTWSFNIIAADSEHPSDTKLYVMREATSDPPPADTVERTELTACQESSKSARMVLEKEKSAALAEASARILPSDLAGYRVRSGWFGWRSADMLIVADMRLGKTFYKTKRFSTVTDVSGTKSHEVDVKCVDEVCSSQLVKKGKMRSGGTTISFELIK